MSRGRRLAVVTPWTWTRHASRHTHLQQEEDREQGEAAGSCDYLDMDKTRLQTPPPALGGRS